MEKKQAVRQDVETCFHPFVPSEPVLQTTSEQLSLSLFSVKTPERRRLLPAGEFKVGLMTFGAVIMK